MKNIDQIMSIRPDAAELHPKRYENYRTGLKWAGIGVIAIGAGLAGNTLGMEQGQGLALAGALEMLGGGAVSSVNLDLMNQD